jgi:hypothetical protein
MSLELDSRSTNPAREAEQQVLASPPIGKDKVTDTGASSKLAATVAEEGTSGACGKTLESAGVRSSKDMELLLAVLTIAVDRGPVAGAVTELASCGAEEGSSGICSAPTKELTNDSEQSLSGDIGLLQAASSVSGDPTVSSDACEGASWSEVQSSCVQRRLCKASRAKAAESSINSPGGSGVLVPAGSKVVTAV